ncbi:hypothetical protein MMC10_003230 [Thelotrema lepadinum]|nr:hypothetical protein [Thelotrema lepadinum]
MARIKKTVEPEREESSFRSDLNRGLFWFFFWPILTATIAAYIWAWYINRGPNPLSADLKYASLLFLDETPCGLSKAFLVGFHLGNKAGIITQAIECSVIFTWSRMYEALGAYFVGIKDAIGF